MSLAFGRNTSWVDGLINEVNKLDEKAVATVGQKYDANKSLAARRSALDVVRAHSLDREAGWARGFAKGHVDRRLDGAIEDAVLGIVVADKIDKSTYERLTASLREGGVSVPSFDELHPR